MQVDYVAVTDHELGEAPHRGAGRLVVAVYLDGTRLIDNAPVELGGGA
jgi:pantoate--beta-alanine ligase